MVPGAAKVPLSKSKILEHLHELFDGRQWRVKRCYLRSLPDQQSFINANIIAIVEESQVDDKTTLSDLEAAKADLKRYQANHLGYHWPLDENGRSRISGSPVLRRIDYFSLDADADCTCLLQIALQEKGKAEDIVKDLIFYCLDGERFSLPLLQQHLPNTAGTFLTWFPPKNQCVGRKEESVDITVDANILWYLGKINRLDVRGVSETIEFIDSIVDSDWILKSPGTVSPYYPYPLVILYSIARAISWGRIAALEGRKERLMAMASSVRLRSQLDHLLLASIGIFLGNDEFASNGLRINEFTSMLSSPFYVCPPFFAIGNMLGPWLRKPAQWPWLRITFQSEALQWAMLLWVYHRIGIG